MFRAYKKTLSCECWFWPSNVDSCFAQLSSNFFLSNVWKNHVRDPPKGWKPTELRVGWTWCVLFKFDSFDGLNFRVWNAECSSTLQVLLSQQKSSDSFPALGIPDLNFWIPCWKQMKVLGTCAGGWRSTLILCPAVSGRKTASTNPKNLMGLIKLSKGEILPNSQI